MLLHILRKVVKWHAREHGFPEAEADCLALTIDEAAGNVIRHTYAGQPGKMLSVEMVAYPDRMEFILEDAGPKVKGESARSGSLDSVPAEGPGTLFIQAYIDTSSYETSYGEGNRLKLVKFLPGKAPAKE